jgi:GNAT superfamily N-acetyltransferase
VSLTVHADPETIRSLLHRAVAADPVRGTTLGTIAAALERDAWCATAEDGRLAVRSGTEYPVVLSGRWEPAILGELVDLLRGLPALRGVTGSPDTADAIAVELWADRPLHRMRQCLFRLDELVEPRDVAGAAVLASDADRDLVRRWFVAFTVESGALQGHPEEAADRALKAGGCFLWRDPAGTPVSFASRRPVVGGSARVGPVYTPPEERSRGYGSAVTAAATRSILDDGAVPVLFTDVANPTSNKIYQALGYQPVETRLTVTLW